MVWNYWIEGCAIWKIGKQYLCADICPVNALESPGPGSRRGLFFDEASAHVILRCLRRRPLLAHGFAKQSAVCYTPCRRCRGQGVCESPRPSPCASACGLTSTNRESGFSASPPVLFHSRTGLLFLPPLYPAAS